ncbi:DUF3540 domain-containing protein [Pseudomonas sp. DWP3-1-2]|uniref:DUF3540 domain-containing protein n=1 Tax=Pseudomonas sp. DWP3-1-2 TaxID=2804645 RepID=UPI003CF0DEC2
MQEALHVIDSPAVLRHAQINAVSGERFGVVSTQGHRYWLKPAMGCLLQPAVGDTVLITLAGEDGYILSVLERTQWQPAQLRVEGDVHFNLPSGALSIEARDGLSADAGPMLALRADQMVAHFAQAQVGVTTLSVTGERSDHHWSERNDSAIRHCEKAVRHTAHYSQSRREVKGHEELTAGSLRQRVDKDWSLRGETLDLFAEVAVAVSGKQIKLG